MRQPKWKSSWAMAFYVVGLVVAIYAPKIAAQFTGYPRLDSTTGRIRDDEDRGLCVQHGNFTNTTYTDTDTGSATATGTATAKGTAYTTASETSTPSGVYTATATCTASDTQTVTITETGTASASLAGTATVTASKTFSGSTTTTDTTSGTGTVTVTGTVTETSTVTWTKTQTNTAGQTATLTAVCPSGTATSTMTVITTDTITATVTGAHIDTASVTATGTGSTSWTYLATDTATGICASGPVSTLTTNQICVGDDMGVINYATITTTSTMTGTGTGEDTASTTGTASSTKVFTGSQTTTGTCTAGETLLQTVTVTATGTITNSGTVTSTVTVTASNTATTTETTSGTGTVTLTGTEPATESASWTESESQTQTGTALAGAPCTATGTETATMTISGLKTFTQSTTSTGTVTGTITGTSTESASWTWSSTGTATGTCATGPTSTLTTTATLAHGSGTTGYLPQWSDPTTLTDSIASGNATTIAINATGPKLQLKDGLLTSGFASEVSGELVDFGTNYTILGGRNDSYYGGYFRLDVRDANPGQLLSLWLQDAVGTTALMYVSRAGALTMIDDVSGVDLNASSTVNAATGVYVGGAPSLAAKYTGQMALNTNTDITTDTTIGEYVTAGAGGLHYDVAGTAAGSVLGASAGFATGGGIPAAVEFNRTSMYNWGSRIRFLGHPPNTSNLYALSEMATLATDGLSVPSIVTSAENAIVCGAGMSCSGVDGTGTGTDTATGTGTRRLLNATPVTVSVPTAPTEYTVTLPTTTTNAAGVAHISNVTDFAAALRVGVVVTTTGFKLSGVYNVPLFYNATAGSWYEVLPISHTGATGAVGNWIALDVMITNADAYLRIRRVAGTGAATAYVSIQAEGAISTTAQEALTDTYTSTSVSVYPYNALSVIAGKAGVGTSFPLYAFDVNGTVRSTGNSIVCGAGVSCSGIDGTGTATATASGTGTRRLLDPVPVTVSLDTHTHTVTDVSGAAASTHTHTEVLVLPHATKTLTVNGTSTLTTTDLATTTPTASKIPLAGTDGKIDVGWLPISVVEIPFKTGAVATPSSGTRYYGYLDKADYPMVTSWAARICWKQTTGGGTMTAYFGSGETGAGPITISTEGSEVCDSLDITTWFATHSFTAAAFFTVYDNSAVSPLVYSAQVVGTW